MKKVSEMYDILEKVQDFPHIRNKIITYWGTEKLRDDLQVILFKDTRTDRQGFPLETFTALKDLLELHDDRFPHLVPQKTPWDHY